ncbi:alpha/beta hydrolase [Actinoplanes solisilvae]|uniref:alpha/beta hydrolase n=1 Tax=Actinoplanes solisilvae TaxID=2486853 RepID=UPI000FD90B35|nr:alpha/beta hydrolase-fold protein [Actinoplanes solisilvae]
MSTVLSLAAVLLTAVLLATVWNRSRPVARTGLAVLSLISVAAAAGVQVNRLTEIFPSVVKDDPGGSQLRMVTVPGALTLPMYVYLPAAYNTGSDRYPVITAFHGFPGTPEFWLRDLDVQSVLDREIAAGRMAPTVVLFPSQTPDPLRDTECTDMRDGPQAETYLTVDVPAYAKAHFRVRPDAAGWGLTGYSAGAFCAINLLLRHPDKYAAAASLSGYAAPGIDIDDGSQNTTNNPLWRLRNLPQPPVALWLGWAGDDLESAHESQELAASARTPLEVTTAVVKRGGHNSTVWRLMEAPAFDWLSARLARPLTVA